MTDLPSASQMHRHANCPGNRILIRSLRDRGLLKEEQPSLEATVGQRIHAALEGLGEPLTLSEEDIKNDCDRLSARAARQLFGNEQTTVTNEERLYYKIEGVAFFTGKPDRVFRGAERLLDINFKTGRKEAPSAHLNLQLRTEVVLLSHVHACSTVGAALVEPLVTKRPEIVLYQEEDLKQAEAEILGIVDRTNYVTERKAGAWCTHCPARACCPDAYALAAAEPLHVYTPELPRGEAGAKRLEALEAAYSILDAQWDYYKDLVRKEYNAIPGWHIGEGHEVRSVDAGAMMLIAQKLGLQDSLKDLIKESVSITHLETLMSKYWNLRGKEFDDKFSRTFRDAIKVARTKGSLKRIPKRLLK